MGKFAVAGKMFLQRLRKILRLIGGLKPVADGRTTRKANMAPRKKAGGKKQKSNKIEFIGGDYSDIAQFFKLDPADFKVVSITMTEIERSPSTQQKPKGNL